MRILLSATIISALAFLSFAQSTPASSAQATDPQYQVGTIMAVKPHDVTDANSASVPRYDVSIRVVDTDFVVLYTPQGGTGVEYKAGMEVPVLVGSNTLTVRDLLGNKLEAPIISRKTLPAQRVP